ISATGATISPGDSGVGLLTSTGAVAFDANSDFDVTLSGTTAGTEYSQLKTPGSLTLANATLNLAFGAGFTPVSGNHFTIINNTGSGATSGTFANLPQGGTIAVSGTTFSIDYAGGDGNDVVLTAVQTETWTGADAGTNKNWSDANNWQGGVIPVAGSVLV